jgi:ADP-dependent NAD(P)H-hydrate dehydratase
MRVSPPAELTAAVLSGLAPPEAAADATKHDRGTALVIGGTEETLGSVLLAGLAALRAGAGRLQLAVDGPTESLGIAVPEARVTRVGEATVALARASGATLVGPGVLEPGSLEPVIDEVTATMDDGVLVVDAGGLRVVGRHPAWLRRLGGRAVLLPNPDEIDLLGVPDARAAAERFDAVVAVRGAETHIATPEGEHFLDRHGCPGLATSGSGDVASGIAVGFLARGASPLGAAAWAVAVHGQAGELLGAPGFLARELLDVIPRVVHEQMLPS